MTRSSYRDRNYNFGQAMLTLRSAIGLTQEGLANFLGVSRRAVGSWESGSKYPKSEHLKQFIALAVQQRAFPTGHEADEIRALWQSAHQKVLLDEYWLAALLTPLAGDTPASSTPITAQTAERGQKTQGERNAVPNLPFQSTAFIGRGDELDNLARLLSDPKCRLLTLLGPGGIGKTRLSIEVGSSQAGAFDDGIAFVALASIGTPNQIVSAIGTALNLSFGGHADPKERLLDYLSERHMLLLLDNFEHVLEGADLVYEILQRAPAVKMLVTSRVQLDLQAEWLFDVEGLSYPAISTQTLEDISGYSAVELFVQRATQVHLTFRPTQSTLASIVRICQQVAGMPLAIELAAASVRTLSVDEIESQIRLNLDALATTFRDVPARHRSMRAVFDQSWNLLSDSERILFTRLSVFRGNCSVEAVDQITGAALPALMALVGKSLLRQVSVQNQVTGTVELRFFLLEPIREYALEKLAARGETGALQHAHAVYYLAVAERVMADWDAVPVTDQIERDLNNIRAALQWARDSGHSTIGLQLAGVLWRFWRSAGYSTEGRAWLEELLALTDASSEKEAMSTRLLAMHAAAWLASDQHDYARATELFDQSVPLRRALGETEADTHMLHNLALQARAEGDYQKATTYLQDALTRNRALSSGGLGQSLYEMGFSLYGLALLLREQGDYAGAISLFEECLEFHRDTGDREGVAQSLLGLGDVARDQGDITGTRHYTEQSLAIYRDSGTQWAIGFGLNNLAQAAYQEGDLPQALALANESSVLFRAIQNDGGIAEILVTLGYILLAQGDTTASREALTEALRFAHLIGPRLLLAAALEGLASTITEPDQAALAVQLFSAASSLRIQMGTPVRPADQMVIERALTNAHSVLGEKRFEALWLEAGRGEIESILRLIPGVLPPDEPPPVLESTSVVEVMAEPAAQQKAADSFDGRRMDWDRAVRMPSFYGREWELNLLKGWVVEERCRVITLLGLGGIGKSTLAVNLMHQVAEHFEVVIWRSLRDISSCEVLLDDLLQVLAPEALRGSPMPFEHRMTMLVDNLRSTRILIVLDNAESTLAEGEGTGTMRPEYEGFGQFLRQSAETEHQSCILLTSREKPSPLVPLEGIHAPVRVLRLARLDVHACERLLLERGIVGTEAEQTQLIDAYAGNPLALKIVSQTIVDLFDGALAPFLEQGELIFGGIRELLAAQFNRLSRLEQSVVMWLAIMREPSTLAEIMAVLATPVPRSRLLEAIQSLHRRSMIERGHQQGSFTLQSVIMEYVTSRLIEDSVEAVREGNPSRLTDYGFTLAHSREHVRQTQEYLIAAPILTSLQSIYRQQTAVEEHLLALLRQLSGSEEDAQGYSPANTLTLLRLLRGSLSGLDLSGLMLRGVYLQGVEMQNTTLANSTVQDTIFTETFDVLTAVAISSTGEYWAAASRSGEIRLWAEGGLNLRRSWRAHTDMIWSLTFSPDGLTLASASWDGAVRLWEAASGALLWSGTHTSHAKSVAFSPDGTMLASSGNDALVQLWDAANGTLLQTLPHPLPIPVVAWSPSGNLLATGDMDGVVRLWEVSRTGPAIEAQTLSGHSKWVDGLAFSPDGKTLASASWDGTVTLWGMPDGQLLHTLTAHTDRALRVAWSPNGRMLATGGRDGMIWLWDVEHASYRASLRGHKAGIDGLAFTPDNQRILSSSEDGTLRVWDVASAYCIRMIQGYATVLYDIAWSPDGTRLMSGGSDDLVTIYSLTDAQRPQILHGHGGVVFGVGWSSGGRRMASSEWDNIILLWNAGTDRAVQTLHHPDDSGNYFHGLAWSPDGKRLATGTYRRGAHVFEIASERQSWRSVEFPTWIRHVAWSPDGMQLAGGGDDGVVYVWDAESGTLRLRLVGHHSMITRLDWNAQGTRLASGGSSSEGGELIVWDTQRGEAVRTFVEPSGIVSAVAWASDNTIISGGGDGMLRWWNVMTGESLAVREAHQGTVQALKSSPDGQQLASCGDDGAIMIWDLHTADYLQTVRRDRPYERLNVTGIKGLSEGQKATLLALGAVEEDR